MVEIEPSVLKTQPELQMKSGASPKAIFIMVVLALILLLVFSSFDKEKNDEDLEQPEPPIIEETNQSSAELNWVASVLPGWPKGIQVKGDYAYLAVNSGILVLDVSNASSPEYAGFVGTQEGFDVTIHGDFAFVADGKWGLRIIDITNPLKPFEVGHYDTLGSVWNVYVEDEYAYLAAQEGGLRILDISDYSNPFEVGNISIPNYKSNFNGVSILDNFAYVACSNGLRVFDISNISHPREVAYNDGGEGTPGEFTDVVIVDNLAYLLGLNYGGLYIYDISNPISPQIIGSSSVKGISLKVKESYAYVSSFSDYYDGFNIVNISNKKNPEIISNIGNPIVAYGIDVLNNYAYVTGMNYTTSPDDTGISSSKRGLFIFDITNISRPIEKSFYRISGQPFSLEIIDDNLYVADGISGLQSVNISDINHPTYEWGLPARMARDVAVKGDHVFTASYDQDVNVFDVTDSLKPEKINIFNLTRSSNSIAVSGNFAYLGSIYTMGYYDNLFILNISDPKNISLVSNLNDTGSITDIIIRGKLVYLGLHNGLQIIDVSDPLAPIEISRFNTAEVGGHQIYLNNDTLFLASEDVGLYIINITDPSAPELISVYNKTKAANGVVVAGTYAFVAAGRYGLVMLNVSDLSNPVQLTTYPSDASNIAISENYLFLMDSYSQVQILQYNINLESKKKTSPPLKPELNPDQFELSELTIIFSLAIPLFGFIYAYYTSGETGRYHLGIFFAPLMAKRRQRRMDDPLAHATRNQLIGALKMTPGAHYSMLQKRLKLNNGNLAHHLRILEREGFVSSRKLGRLRCFYLVSEDEPTPAWVKEEGVDVNQETTFPPYFTEIQQQIQANIENQSGISQKELAVALGVTSAAIKYHTDILIKRGVIRKVKHGIWVAYYLNE